MADEDQSREEQLRGFLHNVQQQWQASHDLAEAIMAFSPAALVVIDEFGMIQLFNLAASELFGYAPDEVIGKNLEILMPEPYRSEHTHYLERYRLTGESRLIRQPAREFTILTKAGESVPVELLVNEMLIGDRRYFVGFLHDIRQRKKREAELEYLASHDPVTGLLNYHELARRMDRLIQRHESFVLFYLGLDRFRPINELLGREVGDLVLRRVGERLVAMGLDGLQVARIGGSVFAMMWLDDCSEAKAVEIGQAMHRCLERPLKLEDFSVDIESSIGIVCHHEDEPASADDLLRQAEIAMRNARKRQMLYALYDRSMEQYQLQHLTLISDLRRAIEQDELELHFQPKVDIAHRQVIGAEALVRWQHPEKGMVRPDLFIPLAEESGVIHPFTEWLVDTAARQLRDWREDGYSLSVSINLAPRNLLEADLPERIGAPLSAYGVEASRLITEVTERGLMVDPQRAMRVLERLQAMGMAVSIDDFGTGYSSLAYLKDLPIDEIKIDQRFVRRMNDDPRSLEIVRLILQLAHSLNLGVTAEGVETQEEWEHLASLGCAQAQGYFMGRPMPACEIGRWLRDGQWQVMQKPNGGKDSRSRGYEGGSESAR